MGLPGGRQPTYSYADSELLARAIKVFASLSPTDQKKLVADLEDRVGADEGAH